MKELGEEIPRYLRNIQNKKKEMEKNMSEISVKSGKTDPASIRNKGGEVSTKFNDFISVLLLKGCSLVAVDQFGETTQQEIENSKAVKWQNNLNLSHFHDLNLDFPYKNNKLVGGQQFDRLLTEFASVVSQIDYSELSFNSQAKNSERKSDLNRDFLFTCCENVSHASFQVFSPIFNHFVSRGTHIMKRLFDIFLIHTKSSDLPFLNNFLRENYYRFLENNASLLFQNCQEEILNPLTLFWKFQNDTSFTNVLSSHSTTIISCNIFKDFKKRLTQNVILKFYRFFLDPVCNQLNVFLKQQLLTLNEDSVNQIFEIDSISEELIFSKKKILQKIDEVERLEIKCEEIVSDFLYFSREIITF